MTIFKRLQKALKVLIETEETTNVRPPGPPKLYVLVRGDIPPGYQIAQAIHAKDEFTHTHPELEKQWRDESNTIVVLNVHCQHELMDWVHKASFQGIRFAVFHEPDLEGEPTAAAFEHGSSSSELFSRLPLALK